MPELLIIIPQDHSGTEERDAPTQSPSQRKALASCVIVLNKLGTSPSISWATEQRSGWSPRPCSEAACTSQVILKQVTFPFSLAHRELQRKF